MINIALQGKIAGKHKKGGPATSLNNSIVKERWCSIQQISTRFLDCDKCSRRCLAVCPGEAVNCDTCDSDKCQ